MLRKMAQLKVLSLFFFLLQFCSCQHNFFHSNSKLSFKTLSEVEELEWPNISINKTVVDNFINQIMNCHDILGTGIAIVQLSKNNSVIDHYAQGYGVLDVTKTQSGKADSSTKFCLGSITKQFTAGALGKALMERGHDFDTELIELLGEAGRFFDHINLDAIPTVRDLLSHRMAIPRYDLAWMCGIEEPREEFWKRLHFLGDGDKKYLAKNYRSSFEYNNLMVSLAGSILQNLTGRSWEEEIRNTYFNPLNMTEADFIHTAKNYDDFCQTAYRIRSDPSGQTIWKQVDPFFIRDTTRVIAPAGTICLSAEDMEKYITFLVNSDDDNELKPLKASILRNWVEASNVIAESEIGDKSIPEAPYVYVSDEYSLCWERGVYKNYQHVSHAGDVYGYNSQIFVFPKIKLAIMVSNSQGFADYVYATNIALGLFDLVMPTSKDITADLICTLPNSTALPDPDSMKPFKTCKLPIDEVNLKLLAGVYQHKVFGNMTIAYNETAEYKFYGSLGRFMSGLLCRTGEELPPNSYKLYVDPEGPFWYANDGSIEAPSEVLFLRDSAQRGTRIVAPFIEPRAPTIESQTFYKIGYNACEPSPCMNGGKCTAKGTFDFECSCPPPVEGVICEIGPNKDCSDLKKYYPEISKTSGVKPIQDPTSPNRTVNVYCDMETADGGWTVIHRRVSGSDSFNVTFDVYKNGDGLAKYAQEGSNFWFGLERISNLASSAQDGYTLRIDLKDCQNRSAFEEYSNFWLGGEKDNYTLHIDQGSASGTAGDALTINNVYTSHNGRPFTTFDHDLEDPNECAKVYGSGWWFNDCYTANLNGVYDDECQSVDGNGIMWLPWRSNKISMKFAQMMIRRTV